MRSTIPLLSLASLGLNILSVQSAAVPNAGLARRAEGPIAHVRAIDVVEKRHTYTVDDDESGDSDLDLEKRHTYTVDDDESGDSDLDLEKRHTYTVDDDESGDSDLDLEKRHTYTVDDDESGDSDLEKRHT